MNKFSISKESDIMVWLIPDDDDDDEELVSDVTERVLGGVGVIYIQFVLNSELNSEWHGVIMNCVLKIVFFTHNYLIIEMIWMVVEWMR